MLQNWIHLFLALISISISIHLLLLISRIQDEPNNWDKISVFDEYEEARNSSNINDESENECSMANCFNFTKCMDTERLKVYVYPDLPGILQSKIYANILNVIRQSQFYTNNPDEACIFVPSIDTTDRDRISANYIKNIDSYFTALSKHIWNGGLNHLIFNIYFGTFPNYADNELGFDPGKAMLAWSSSNFQNFRRHFDISFPLFHQEYPLKPRKAAANLQFNFSGHDQFLATFKGKRYVYGIGSEARDILHHLHNNRTILIATTCRHNSDWKKFEDERCEMDNAKYDSLDYNSLMENSTFCLIPRGRRLGSFRFIESLRSICIPVILSDDWVLPFEEVVDWAELAIFGSERNALFVSDYLSRIPENTIHKMRILAQLVYKNHFASIEQIVRTTFEIIFERIKTNLGIESNENWMCNFNDQFNL